MAIDSTQAKALAERIGDLRFAMFCYRDAGDHLLSQPMTLQQVDDQGALWFFVNTSADLWQAIGRQAQVNVSFADSDDALYVSVSGSAQQVTDRAKIREMWNPMVDAWFPNGPDDPHAVLVQVVTHGAEYWDIQDNKMVRMFEMARAAITGKPPSLDTEHGTINL